LGSSSRLRGRVLPLHRIRLVTVRQPALRSLLCGSMRRPGGLWGRRGGDASTFHAEHIAPCHSPPVAVLSAVSPSSLREAARGAAGVTHGSCPKRVCSSATRPFQRWVRRARAHHRHLTAPPPAIGTTDVAVAGAGDLTGTGTDCGLSAEFRSSMLELVPLDGVDSRDLYDLHVLWRGVALVESPPKLHRDEILCSL
jgi:hypothetical protein